MTFVSFAYQDTKRNLGRQDRRKDASLRVISKLDTNLDLGALDLGIEPVVRGEGDRQEGSGDYTGYGGKGQRHRGARHLDILSSVSSLFVSLSLLLRRPRFLSLSLFLSFFLPSLPLASPRTQRDYVVVTATDCGHQRARRRSYHEAHHEEENWTTLRRILENAGAPGSLDPAGAPGNKKGAGGEGVEEEVRLTSGYNIRVLHRPSGCALRRDAHHTTIPVATATILTARLPTHLEGKPAGEPAERARRENRTPGGDGLVASGRYITCVLTTAVLNVCNLPSLHLAPGTTREGRIVKSSC